MPDGQRDWKITEMELWECLQRYRELSHADTEHFPKVERCRPCTAVADGAP
jgi:hypothetical protein